MARLTGVLALAAAMAGGASEGVEYEVRAVEKKKRDDGSYRVVVEITKTGSWTWESVSVRDFLVKSGEDVEGAPTVGVELTSPVPTGTIPDRFQLVFETQPVSNDVPDPRLLFRLEVKAKRDAGASSAGRLSI